MGRERVLPRLARTAVARIERVGHRRVLLLGAAMLLAARLALSAARSGPVIMADEAGFLFNARVLAGGMAAEMGSSPFYRGGYSLIVAPVLALDLEPVATYHGVLVVNAVLAACLVPLLYLLLTRCFGVAQRTAAWAALAGAAYPSVTALSQVALSENVLFGLTVAWLLFAGLLVRGDGGPRARAGWAAAAALLAAALWTVHGRMLVAVALTALVLAACAVRRRADRAAAGAGLALLGCAMAAGGLLNHWLLTANDYDRGFDEVARVLGPLDDLDGIAAVLRNLAGQGWYLFVATLGIVVLLLAHVAAPAFGRMRARRGEPADRVLALLLATTAGLLVLSALWFASAQRPDQLIYGRYAEPVAPALVAVGLALLGGMRRRPLRAAVLAAGLLALTAAVAALRSGLDVSSEASRWNVAALPSVTGSLDAPVLGLGGVVAAGALCMFAAAARRLPGALAPLALLAFLPTTAYVVDLPVLRSERDIYPPAWTSPLPAVERHDARAVGYDLDRFDHIRVKVYQWFMPQTPVVLFRGERERPPAELFFSAERLSGGLAGEPAVAVWTDPGADQALWRRVPARP
jgi:hypothetical protein